MFPGLTVFLMWFCVCIAFLINILFGILLVMKWHEKRKKKKSLERSARLDIDENNYFNT